MKKRQRKKLGSQYRLPNDGLLNYSALESKNVKARKMKSSTGGQRLRLKARYTDLSSLQNIKIKIKIKKPRTEAQITALKKAQETLKKLRENFTKEQRALYSEMRKLMKNKENLARLMREKPGYKKPPTVDTLIKAKNKGKDVTHILEENIRILKNIVSQYDLDVLAEKIERYGRNFDVDVYDIVAKLRSGDYEMTGDEFKEFKDALISSNNPSYIEHLQDPRGKLVELKSKLEAFFEDYND